MLDQILFRLPMARVEKSWIHLVIQGVLLIFYFSSSKLCHSVQLILLSCDCCHVYEGTPLLCLSFFNRFLVKMLLNRDHYQGFSESLSPFGAKLFYFR